MTQNHYTKTIQFRDINYQLSDNEDKQAIFDGWCDFLNYFDSSVSFQLSFINLTGLRGAALRTIPVRTDQFESIQRELSDPEPAGKGQQRHCQDQVSDFWD